MARKLTDIKGIGETTAKKLRSAGVKTVEDLRAIDVDDIAGRSGIKGENLRRWRDEAATLFDRGIETVASATERASSTAHHALTDIKGVGDQTAQKLREAGVKTVEDLRGMDVEDIATRTGLRQDLLAKWRDEAADLLEGGVETVAKATEQAGARAGEAAVVLRDRATTAKVRLEGVLHENFPIITAKLEESQDQVAKTIEENAVLLKEKADTAWVRIEGEWHKNVPIFKERVSQGEQAAKGAVEEVRVFVKEIRENPVETLKPANLLDRLLGRKPAGGGASQSPTSPPSSPPSPPSPPS